MRPDNYHKDNEQYRTKKSKSTEQKIKKAIKNRTKEQFRNYVQDFLDNRDNKDYNIDN